MKKEEEEDGNFEAVTSQQDCLIAKKLWGKSRFFLHYSSLRLLQL